MDSTIIAATLITIAIILAAVAGLVRFRTKPEDRKKSDIIEFAPINNQREKETGKNRRQKHECDIPTFNRLQKLIDSNWIQNFENNQLTYPQYVQAAITDDLHAYCNESRKLENQFSNQKLAEAHLVFIKAISAFINTVLRETTFVRPESNASVINSKADRPGKSSKDYDERYNREVRAITNRAKGIINTYKRYVQIAVNESVNQQSN